MCHFADRLHPFKLLHGAGVSNGSNLGIGFRQNAFSLDEAKPPYQYYLVAADEVENLTVLFKDEDRREVGDSVLVKVDAI